MEIYFYIDCDHISICYPCKTRQYLDNLGVLEQYKNKKYSLEEINKIIADIIIKTPFVNNSMNLDINVCYSDGKAKGFHHIISIKNYWYENQQKEDKPEIKYMF